MSIPYEGDSTAPGTPGLKGTNSGSGNGVFGASGSGAGVYGTSTGFDAVVGETGSNGHAGVTGRNLTNGSVGGVGVYGVGGQFAGKFDGPVLVNQLLSPQLPFNPPASGFAIYASCTSFDAIVGETLSNTHAAVTGRNKTNGGAGVYGTGGQFAGKFDGNLQVNGVAEMNSLSVQKSGIPAAPVAEGDVSIGGSVTAINVSVLGRTELTLLSVQKRGVPAPPMVEGDVSVGRDLTVGGTVNVIGNGSHSIAGTLNVGVDITLANQDCAEDFDVANCAESEAGTVMVLDDRGLLQESRHAYDRKVAGVISGAGEFKPGLILGRDKGHRDGHRAPVALVGKVYCKVDAQHAPIEIGDLLTTSTVNGHAMKAEDPMKAFGAVIGKALQSMPAGQKGLIPILVALQ